ncbi:SIT4 phosphatase-associated protein-domain-containing protein [Thelonectria olida]|uniref:SIT4 phosphatase-associated protein-domain-containing protein n=1 Tax=Thelonectria olida TaxID=1576542 RepID=A0A9P8VY03_9HYPO|nr:SIT4 phosphatase-associated protein-domain-containing protein [Thelonectria olida]
MFWRFGGYANISTIDTILDKPEFTLEELLNESDLIQELKQHNTKLIEYLREDKVLESLLEYVVAPKLETIEAQADKEATADDDESKGKGRLLPLSRPRASSHSTDPGNDDEEDGEKKRNRFAFVACEILSSDTWSIYEALAENRQLIRDFWKFLARDAPLDPLQASYFTKVNESLFEKKTEDMMDLLMNIEDAVPNLLKHVECPMIMDLLLKIIALDRSEGGQGVVEWLYARNMIPSLLSCLSPENNWVVQTAAGDFIKAIITISANASQNEQQCIGPNELTRQLVSKPCVEQLIQYMLCGGNPLTVGVGIVIEVIRKNNSDYDPDMGTEANAVPSSSDPIYLGTLLRLFAQNVPKFMSLIMEAPTEKNKINSTFGDKLEPLGFDRFKTCELMAELLHCSNMGLLNEPGSEELIAARDAERNRLRTEGKLGPLKEEEPAMEDLSLRRSHLEEVRRLEVTNAADDDGFEEVEPSKEMSEDTSHEFVKAEVDIPVISGSSLSKDEDDFIDEPLSPADGVSRPQFEDADLVVAPLSPTKPKPAELATDEKSADKATEKTDDAPASEPVEQKKEEDTVSESTKAQDALEKTLADDASDSSIVLTPAPSEPEAKAEPAIETLQVETDPVSGLSPHPEDTPAPLFSAPPAPESGADRPPQATEKSIVEDSTPGAQADASSVPQASDNPPEEDANSVEPVVGDFLKTQFVEYRVVPTILSFFFAYPWNNFLHNVVYDVVQQVFNGPMDRGYNPNLAVSLFEAADVTSAIIRGQRASDESQAKTKTRMGYMGHLTLIAEEVVKFTERHPPELLSETVLDRVMSQEWINYVEGALAETRERDNAILGGVRPDVALGNRAMGGSGLGGVGLSGLGGNSMSSNALAEAGLNGGIELSNENSGNGIGPFTISAGTLMSGFGSSSDEEDDDGEGDEEDVNSEVSDDSNDDLGGDADMNPFGHTGAVESPEDVIMGSPEPIRADSPNFGGDTDMTMDSPMYLGDAGAPLNKIYGIRRYERFCQTSTGTFRAGEDECNDDNVELNDLESFEDMSVADLLGLLSEFRAYTDPLNNAGGSMEPPSIPPPPPPPPPLNIPPSRARLQLAARLAMHQKNSQVAQSSSATLHHDDDDDDDNPADPFADTEEDMDDDDDDQDGGRGSWWRGVVRGRAKTDGNESDDERDDDDDDEFGDFAMAEDERGGEENLVLRPLAVNPAKEGSTRGLSGLWPFGLSKAEKEKESDRLASNDGRVDDAGDGDDKKAVEVKEAKRRTSIEDPDDDEVVI